MRIQPKMFVVHFILFIVLSNQVVRSQGITRVGELKLLTYNVLADPKYYKERIPPLLTILENADADIIALQEVAPWFAKALFEQKWAKKYHVALKDGKIILPHEHLILSKYPIHSYLHTKLPGRQGRTLFVVKISVNSNEMMIGTCHLESLLEDGGIRARQLDFSFKHLNTVEEAIFLGDFNFGDGEQPETDHLDRHYQDVWLALHPGNPGYTWNKEVSMMARKSSFPGEQSRRIDRVLIKSATWKPKKIAIIGNTAVAKDAPHLFPSDHFGLLTTLEASLSNDR